MFTSSIGTSTAKPESLVAHRLGPDQRRTLALEALHRRRPITELSQAEGVSRKFIYEQKARAEVALRDAFEPQSEPDGCLGWIPITPSWIRRVILSAAMDGHASIRGICALVENISSRSISEGTVHNVLEEAVAKADVQNQAQDLSLIRKGAHDEIFSQKVPVLAGVEPQSTFTYLLEASSSRDAASWWVALTDKKERQGLNLATSISDAALGLLAGVKETFPNIELRGDVFHAQMELSELETYLENRAYGRLTYQEQQERKMERAKNRNEGQSRSKPLALARAEAQKAVTLYDDMALLIGWLVETLGLVGPDFEIRRELYDWILKEMEARSSASHRIVPIVRYFKNQRDALLAFVPHITQGLQRIAQTFHVPQALVEAVYQQYALDPDDPRFEDIQRQLYDQAPSQAEAIDQAVLEMLEDVLRASSAVENINSILRTYFFLRRSVGTNFLKLLQFYLNHRRFRRSEHPERVGKSPRELLTGQPHSHWLEMLGYPPVTLQN